MSIPLLFVLALLAEGGVNANDSSINGTSSPGVIEILRPVVFDSFARLPNILEVGSAQVFVLMNVQPKVKYIFRSFALQEQTVIHVLAGIKSTEANAY
jgi:hypothetical protein